LVAKQVTPTPRAPRYTGTLHLQFACGSKVLHYYMFSFFALCERKNENMQRKKYRSAEG